MTAKVWAVVLSIALACVALSTYFGGERAELAAGVDRASTATPAPDRNAEPPLHPAQADIDFAATGANNHRAVAAPAAVPSATEKLAKLSADIGADDAATRAAAIDALAALPKAQALPLLQRVLGDGNQQERQLAVNVLHVLAMDHGDTDGEIRNVLRLAMFDGGDESIADDARNALESIDRDAEGVAVQRAR